MYELVIHKKILKAQLVTHFTLCISFILMIVIFSTIAKQFIFSQKHYTLGHKKIVLSLPSFMHIMYNMRLLHNCYYYCENAILMKEKRELSTLKKTGK